MKEIDQEDRTTNVEIETSVERDLEKVNGRE